MNMETAVDSNKLFRNEKNDIEGFHTNTYLRNQLLS